MEEGIKKEREWVEKLCKKIKKHDKFNEWSENGQKYDIYYEVALPHLISLNNLVSIDEKSSKIIYKKFDNASFEKYTNRLKVDILVVEKTVDGVIPRVVVEAKYREVNTHDPITYSHKANLHKVLFPGLRYGVIIGNYKEDRKGNTRNEENIYIPARVVEYGVNFDFIYLFKENLNKDEITTFINIIKNNIKMAEILESMDKKDKRNYLYFNKNFETK